MLSLQFPYKILKKTKKCCHLLLKMNLDLIWSYTIELAILKNSYLEPNFMILALVWVILASNSS